jgi:hypothetical protein
MQVPRVDGLYELARELACADTQASFYNEEGIKEKLRDEKIVQQYPAGTAEFKQPAKPGQPGNR